MAFNPLKVLNDLFIKEQTTLKNGVSSSFPATITANYLIKIISTTTGSKAYFTIKGTL
jgi:hypothetical protein